MSAPPSRRPKSSPLDAYSVRAMLGLVASLSLMLVLVHLPLSAPVSRVGWSAHPPAEQIVVDEIRSEEDEGDADAEEQSLANEQVLASAPPTTIIQPPSSKTSPTTASAPDANGSSSAAKDTTRTRRFKKIQAVTELDITDRTPHIVGGVGSLYLHIKYPQKALQQGIEGRLSLEFTVERDGSVRDLEVVESLHPLCDSAAVEGVRAVEFVPATYNGEPIPIRLRLPVHFRLTAATSPSLSKEQSP